MKYTRHLLVEGWSRVPHSYALVNTHQLEVLTQLPNLKIHYREMPHLQLEWTARWAQTSPAVWESQIDDSVPPAGTPVLRVAFPYSLNLDTVPENSKLYLFYTAECGAITPDMTDVPKLCKLVKQGSIELITPSRWSARAATDLGLPSSKVHVIPHGVWPDRCTTQFDPLSKTWDKYPTLGDIARRKAAKEPTFVYMVVGAMTDNKNVAAVIRNFIKVAKRRKFAYLVAKGLDEIYRSRQMFMETVIANLDFSDDGALEAMERVYYLGNTLSEKEMSDMYSLADCMVSPYKMEGFNMPALECTARGIPTILTDGGSTLDFACKTFAVDADVIKLPDGGYVLQPDEGVLLKRMLKVIDHQKTSLLAARVWGADIRKHFSWDVVCQKLLDTMH